RFGQPVEPDDTRGKWRGEQCQAFLLPRTQIRAHFEYEIALRQRAERGESLHHGGSERTGTRTELEDRATRLYEHLTALACEAATEERRDLGRRGEIAAGTELARPRAVVAEARSVECERHELGEADGSARFPDACMDRLEHARLVRPLVG